MTGITSANMAREGGARRQGQKDVAAGAVEGTHMMRYALVRSRQQMRARWAVQGRGTASQRVRNLGRSRLPNATPGTGSRQEPRRALLSRRARHHRGWPVSWPQSLHRRPQFKPLIFTASTLALT